MCGIEVEDALPWMPASCRPPRPAGPHRGEKTDRVVLPKPGREPRANKPARSDWLRGLYIQLSADVEVSLGRIKEDDAMVSGHPEAGRRRRAQWGRDLGALSITGAEGRSGRKAAEQAAFEWGCQLQARVQTAQAPSGRACLKESGPWPVNAGLFLKHVSD